MAPKARPPNVLEKKIHQAGTSASKHVLSQKDIEALAPDPAQRLDAVNFLIGTGLLVPLRDGNKTISFKAVMKEEMQIKKEMGGEEAMVLSQIQASGNEGIWTKHLKAKTELHQTVINRCLKSLEQKQLIKSIKSVKHPTRKIYMLFNLEPSVEVTGGPWYTDNELDSEFIKMLCSACLQYIRDRTLPRGSMGASPANRKLYPISEAPPYPTAPQVLSFLQKSRVTDTDLGQEHIEMLLDVLVFDGLIERLPAFGVAMWNPEEVDDGSENEEEVSFKKSKSSKKSKRRRKESSGEEEEEDPKPSKKKRRKGSVSQSDSPKAAKKKSRKRQHDSSDDSSDIDNTSRRKKKRGKLNTSDSEHDSDEPSGDEKPKSSKKKKDISSFEESDLSGNVYRAVYEDHSLSTFGWSETPCSRCQQFDFCDGGSGLILKGIVDLEEGPVNPRNCVYYEGWLDQDVVD